ncbi:MAG: hypothetical protein BM564_00775 [Bacteroidetes bacterium MedPE-SWsnd-G2]|nr:MAG: hypothetical protein BM564_00775 [Bacteroidetes bacterium MedPE-SWsnd-G2]
MPHKIRFFILSITLSISLGISTSSYGQSKSSENDKSNTEYSFFIAGHTYGKPFVVNDGVHPPFKAKFDLIKNDSLVEFGVFTGDIVWTGTKKNWNEIDADIADLGIPVYFAAGNHDVINRPLFESRYGKTYKSFIHNNDLVIILDPNIDGWNISGDQLIFLKNQLSQHANKVDNIFVFFHQVLWWDSKNIFRKIVLNSHQGRSKPFNFWSEIEPMFNALPNEVYMFAGDVGAHPKGSEFMYHHYDNITFVASGMGGEQRDNFIFIDVKKDKSVEFRLIALNGDDINALGKLEDYVLDK